MKRLRKSRATSRLKKPLSGSTSVQRPSGISPDGSRAAQASYAAMTSRVSVSVKFRTPLKSNRIAAKRQSRARWFSCVACRPAINGPKRRADVLRRDLIRQFRRRVLAAGEFDVSTKPQIRLRRCPSYVLRVLQTSQLIAAGAAAANVRRSSPCVCEDCAGPREQAHSTKYQLTFN